MQKKYSNILRQFFTVLWISFWLIVIGITLPPKVDFSNFTVEIPIQKTAAVYETPTIRKLREFNSLFLRFETQGEGTVQVAVNYGEGFEEMETECEEDFCSGFAVFSPIHKYELRFALTGQGGFQIKNIEVETRMMESQQGFFPRVFASMENLGIISRSEWGANPDYLLYREVETSSQVSSAWQKRINACVALQKEYPDEFKDDGREVTTSASGDRLQFPKTYSKAIRKIVVHSTASDGEKDVNGDNIITIDDMEAIVRAIYYYHANTKAWGDIGYHYLIDPFGNIYEGRDGGNFVVGAHAYCANTGTIGISFIGNYQDKLPSQSALLASEELLGELANLYSLDLTATSFWHGKDTRNLVGHRDYVSTLCPGQKLYDYLDTLAEQAMFYARNNGANADYAYRILRSDSPLYLAPLTQTSATIELKNIGKQTWKSGSEFVISGSEIRKNKFGVELAGGANLIHRLGNDVKPNSTLKIQIPIATKMREGVYRFLITPNFGSMQKFELVVSVAQVGNLDYGVVEAEHPPNPFPPTATKEAWVILKNKTNFTWQAEGENRVVLQTTDGSTSPFTNSPIVGYLESATPPGSEGKFIMELTAPTQSGRYYLEFLPYISNSFALPDYGMKFHITVREPKFEGNVLSKTSGKNLRFGPGESKTLSFTLQNNSQMDWETDNFSFKKIGSGVVIDTDSLKLPHEVKVGGSVEMNFQVTAGVRSGKYRFSLKPTYQNGKVKEMNPIDFLIEVEDPNLLSEFVETPTAFELSEGESAEVVAKLQNDGNVTWRKGTVILQRLPAQASSFANADWISPLQPATLEEDEVKPGETGTFRFTLTKNRKASREVEQFIPILKGLGRIRGKALQIEVRYKSGATSSLQFETSAEINTSIKTVADSDQESPSALSESSKTQPTIRIRLGFAGDKVEIGGGSFALQNSSKQTIFEGSFADFTKAKMQEGEFYRIVPKGDTILEVANWLRGSWDGKFYYNKFRGILEVRKFEGSLVVINELPLEEYLWGIAEPAPSDPDAKKQTMSILARSYALYYIDSSHRKFPGTYWDGDDSPARFQQYLGYNYETRGDFRRFVEETYGQAVTYDGAVVKTPYFTSSNGVTKTAVEAGWNEEDFKFVKSVEDPWSCGYDSSKAGVHCEGNARGHGVGLSGKGAAGLANEGKTYEEIIDYFFDGVEVEKVY